MIFYRRPPLRALGLWTVVLYLDFIAAASLPGIVICYRAEGFSAIEIAVPGVSCSCQECEHCRERLARAWPGHGPDRAVLEVCHCSHEPIMDAAEQSALRRDSRLRTVDYASAEEIPRSPEAITIDTMDSTAFFSVIPPPFSERASALRC